jgi:hypothetical protein
MYEKRGINRGGAVNDKGYLKMLVFERLES